MFTSGEKAEKNKRMKRMICTKYTFNVIQKISAVKCNRKKVSVQQWEMLDDVHICELSPDVP